MLATAARKIKAFKPVFLNPQFKYSLDADIEPGKELYAEIAKSKKDIVAAQRLRYQIFTQEFGAKIKNRRGIDKDRFDKHCRHVIVRNAANGKIVGYTRLLSDVQSYKTKGFYSSTEFQMDAIERLPGRVLEIGRTCIHPAYRNGGTIAVLWAKVAEVLLTEGYDFLIGCASIGLSDGGEGAAQILERIRERYMTEEHRRVEPFNPLKVNGQPTEEKVKMPALLKAYLRMGAKVCGEPYWDSDFNVADVFILLDMKDLPARYSKHFFRQAA